MAITVDQATLGTNYVGGAAATTVTLTTTSAVAAGGFVVVGVGRFGGALDGVVSGGGLSWTVNKEYNDGVSGRVALIASAQAPSGLASSTVLTATFTAALSRTIGAMSFLGVKTSSPVDGTPLGTNNLAAAWSTGNYLIAAGSVITACSYIDAGNTNTPTAPSLEAWERSDAGDFVGCAFEYRIEASAGSYAVQGTWGSANANSDAAVAYLAAPTGTPVLVPRHALGGGRW